MLSLYCQAKIREKYKEGASVEDLAAEFEIHCTTVYHIVQEGRRIRKRRGRPVKSSPTDQRRIVQYFRQNPFASASTAPKILGISLSVTSVRRILKMANIVYKPVKVQLTMKVETA